MKKLLFILCLIIFFSCGTKKYKPGHYIGIGYGNSGEIKVEVVISKTNKISDILVLEYSDTPGISDEVFSKLPPIIIEKNSVEVDIISGATKTSQGLLKAINSALKKALN